MPRLNNEERARALAMLECGLSENEVANRFNCSRSTVTRLVQRVRVTGTLADRPRSGAPRVTTRRQDNFIRQRHLRDRFVTAESTTNLVVGNRGVPVSRYTIRRRLLEQGIRCRRPYRGVILNRRHRQQRLLWARQHLQDRWNSVVFSDESRFNLFNADGRVRVYRRRNERYVNNCVYEINRYGGGGIMVWEAINHGFKVIHPGEMIFASKIRCEDLHSNTTKISFKQANHMLHLKLPTLNNTFSLKNNFDLIR